MQAVKAATGMAARILGKRGIIGALTPSAFADLLVVDGDPLRDVRMLADPERIRLVLLEGRLVRRRQRERPLEPGSAAGSFPGIAVAAAGAGRPLIAGHRSHRWASAVV